MLTVDQLTPRLSYDPGTGAFHWTNGLRAGWRGERGYRRINIDGKSYYEHRLAWLFTHGSWPTGDVDHANGDRSDNRAANLRLATRQQNLRNGRPKGGSSRFKGVHFNRRRGKWQAYITIDRRHQYLGAYAAEDAAAAAYDRAAAQQFGTFAKLNLQERV